MIFFNKKQNKQNKKKDSKAKKQVFIKETKKSLREYFTIFNNIKGYIYKQNIIINEFNEYIFMVKCLKFASLKYLIENMSSFNLKEVEVFVYNKEYYATVKFDKIVINKEKIVNYKNTVAELNIRKTEFYVLSLYEVYKIVTAKVFRDNDYKRSVINNILQDEKRGKKIFQNLLYAKNVFIDNDYIYFNYKKGEENIKHQILGLQMYPSFLYEGFLSEINHLDNIETSTYIKKIDIEKVKENISKTEQYAIIKEYIENKNKLYNTCFYIHIWGNEEYIKKQKEIVLQIANKYHVILNEFFMQQKRAFAAFLPMMNNNIKSFRAISEINGILPFNEDIIKNFICNMNYGKELISDKTLYFNRQKNGIILSSNYESKRRFIQEERNYVAVDLGKNYVVFDFIKNEYKQEDSYKILLSDNKLNIDKYTEEDKYISFKIYCLLCLGLYKEFSSIEKSDIDIINTLYNMIDEKFEINKDFYYIKELFFDNLERNYNLLYKKIHKKYISPDDKLINNIETVFKILQYLRNENNINSSFVYIYNIQEIVNGLPILLREVFNKKTNSLYLFSSYNDFILLNNEYVAKEIFNAPYINIIDVNPNDLMKINNYLNLPNRDLIHLRNQNYIAGMLYTDICEFNYYIEKEENNEI